MEKGGRKTPAESVTLPHGTSLLLPCRARQAKPYGVCQETARTIAQHEVENEPAITPESAITSCRHCHRAQADQAKLELLQFRLSLIHSVPPVRFRRRPDLPENTAFATPLLRLQSRKATKPTFFSPQAVEAMPWRTLQADPQPWPEAVRDAQASRGLRNHALQRGRAPACWQLRPDQRRAES